MQTVINKIVPEWSNFSEANKNFLHNEDQLVKSLEPLQTFEGNNQNLYQIKTLSFLNQKVHEISTVLDDGNQAISCVNLDVKNLESVFNNFQKKKLDRSKYDNSYKRALKKSDAIHEMLVKHQTNLINQENDEDQPEPGSKQEKFDQEFNEYQKSITQGVANILCEISSSKIRTATNIAEIGGNFADKKSPIEIYHKDSIEDLNQEIKILEKIINNANDSLNNEKNIEICDDDDGFTIVQDKKSNMSMSNCDDEY